ncbi:MAG TPA: RDD family protein [Blastococcus sp.]|jgi:uncharacterized RDD family membrane protein YckC|nr:RDD family protein [Blastococcus sp.]
MPGQVDGGGGRSVQRARLGVDPAPARPQPRPAADSRGALHWTADAVPARSAANGSPVPVPAAEARGSGGRPPPAYAGVVTRLLAAAVDAVVVVVLAALLDLAAAGARFLWSPVDFRWPRPTAIDAVVVLLLVAVVYLALGWGLAGRTYGARLMGLRVLSSRHELLGWTRAVLRALVCVLWPIGLLWCGISRARLSFADIVVRSVVAYDARPYARVRGGEPPGGSGGAS